MSVTSLIRKRDELRRAIADAKAQLKTIEAAIGIMGAPRIKRMFARGELSKLVFDAMRQGAGDNTEITEYVMKAMDWNPADDALFAEVRTKVKDVTKRIAR